MSRDSSRQKLVEAMGELMAEKGLIGTTPKDILSRSQVGHGSLYHHFSGKADLALSAIEYNVEQLISQTENVLDSASTSTEKIKALLYKSRDIRQGCRVGNLTYDYSIMSDPEFKLLIARAFTWLQIKIESILREGMNQGEFKSTLSPKEASYMLVSVIQGGYVVARGIQSDEAFKLSISCAMKCIFN